MSEAVRSVWRCFIVRNFPSPVDFHPLRPSHPVPDGVEYLQASRRDRHSSSGYDSENYLKRKKQRDELLGTPNEFEGDRRGRQQRARKKHTGDVQGAGAMPPKRPAAAKKGGTSTAARSKSKAASKVLNTTGSGGKQKKPTTAKSAVDKNGYRLDALAKTHTIEVYLRGVKGTDDYVPPSTSIKGLNCLNLNMPASHCLFAREKSEDSDDEDPQDDESGDESLSELMAINDESFEFELGLQLNGKFGFPDHGER